MNRSYGCRGLVLLVASLATGLQGYVALAIGTGVLGVGLLIWAARPLLDRNDDEVP